MTLALTGSVMAALLTAQAQTWQVGLAMFVLGLGMGLSSSPRGAAALGRRNAW